MIHKKDIETEAAEKLKKLLDTDLEQSGSVGKCLEQQERFDSQRAYARFLSETNDKAIATLPQKRPIGRRLMAVAAVLVLAVLGGWMALNLASEPEVVPGKSKALLTLGGDEAFEIGTDPQVITSREGTRVEYRNGVLSYHTTQRTVASVFDEMYVPRGGECSLILEDGTRIWLNSASKLTYPVAFTGDIRNVTLEGEAYFEIAHNPEKPFVVQTKEYRVIALGTAFCVSAYNDEVVSEVTLVNGKVAISTLHSKDSILLHPKEQFFMTPSTYQCGTREVNTADFTAWREGLFRFNDLPLEVIMRKIERWYNVSVTYDDASLKNIRFGLNVSRQNSIDPLLRMFESNGKIKINRNGSRLVVSKAR